MDLMLRPDPDTFRLRLKRIFLPAQAVGDGGRMGRESHGFAGRVWDGSEQSRVV
jgi:hypothetical protein